MLHAALELSGFLFFLCRRAKCLPSVEKWQFLSVGWKDNLNWHLLTLKFQLLKITVLSQKESCLKQVRNENSHITKNKKRTQNKPQNQTKTNSPIENELELLQLSHYDFRLPNCGAVKGIAAPKWYNIICLSRLVQITLVCCVCLCKNCSEYTM